MPDFASDSFFGGNELPVSVALGSFRRGSAFPFARDSDERLARRASNGDHRAFEAIFERYQQDLYRFCLAMLRDPDDAQDALQNTMVKVLRSLPGEEREIALRPWLYKIARNEAIELRRTSGETEVLDSRLCDRRAEVSEQVEQREQLGWLLRDLEDLPERQRAVLLMRELSGLEFADIGAALGTSSGVVRQSLYEARRNLGQMDFGRSLRCEVVSKVLSDSDGRITGRREIRAHLRGCPHCRRFQDGIEERRQTLAAISPLPAAVALGIAQPVLAGSGGGIGAAAGVGIVKSIGSAGLLKAAVATVATVALVGTAVERPQTFGLGASDPGPARSHVLRAASSGASEIESRSAARAFLGPSSLAAPGHDPTSTAILDQGADAIGRLRQRGVAGGRDSEAPSYASVAVAGRSANEVEDGTDQKAKAEAMVQPERSTKPEAETTEAHPDHPAKPEKTPGPEKIPGPEKTSGPEKKPKPERTSKPEKTSEPPEAPGQTAEHPEHPAHPAHSQKPEKPASPSTPAASPQPPDSSPGVPPTSTVEDSVNGLAKGHEKKLGQD